MAIKAKERDDFQNTKNCLFNKDPHWKKTQIPGVPTTNTRSSWLYFRNLRIAKTTRQSKRISTTMTSFMIRKQQKQHSTTRFPVTTRSYSNRSFEWQKPPAEGDLQPKEKYKTQFHIRTTSTARRLLRLLQQRSMQCHQHWTQRSNSHHQQKQRT